MAPRSTPAAALAEDNDPVLRALESAPLDDRELTPEEHEAMAEALASPRLLPSAEVSAMLKQRARDEG